VAEKMANFQILMYYNYFVVHVLLYIACYSFKTNRKRCKNAYSNIIVHIYVIFTGHLHAYKQIKTFK